MLIFKRHVLQSTRVEDRLVFKGSGYQCKCMQCFFCFFSLSGDVKALWGPLQIKHLVFLACDSGFFPFFCLDNKADDVGVSQVEAHNVSSVCKSLVSI